LWSGYGQVKHAEQEQLKNQRASRAEPEPGAASAIAKPGLTLQHQTCHKTELLLKQSANSFEQASRYVKECCFLKDKGRKCGFVNAPLEVWLNRLFSALEARCKSAQSRCALSQNSASASPQPANTATQAVRVVRRYVKVDIPCNHLSNRDSVCSLHSPQSQLIDPRENGDPTLDLLANARCVIESEDRFLKLLFNVAFTINPEKSAPEDKAV
jgi:hypothetical protein